MSRSGITRRIDELGRIVVPKEIRYNLGIRDGDLLEIYTDNNTIVIKKYSQVENIRDASNYLCDIVSDVCNINILISDREKIIATSKSLNTIVNEKLSDQFKRLIDNREIYISGTKEQYFNQNNYFTIVPIITSTDCSGLIFILSKEKNETNLKYAKIIQKLLVQKLDVA